MADKNVKQSEALIGLAKDIAGLSAGAFALAVAAIGFKPDGTPVLMPAHVNHEVEVLASAARTGDTNSADQSNLYHRGLMLLLDVTAVGGTPGQIDAINIQAKLGANYLSVISFSTLAINTVSQHAFLIYPAVLDAGIWKGKAQAIVPKDWRLSVDQANETDSITYSVTAVYLL